jgi:hypothetical protein
LSPRLETDLDTIEIQNFDTQPMTDNIRQTKDTQTEDNEEYPRQEEDKSQEVCCLIINRNFSNHFIYRSQFKTLLSMLSNTKTSSINFEKILLL